MALAEFTSADANVGAVFVNPMHVVYVVGNQQWTSIGTIVPNSSGHPWVINVTESAQEVCRRLNLAAG